MPPLSALQIQSIYFRILQTLKIFRFFGGIPSKLPAAGAGLASIQPNAQLLRNRPPAPAPRFCPKSQVTCVCGNIQAQTRAKESKFLIRPRERRDRKITRICANSAAPRHMGDLSWSRPERVSQPLCYAFRRLGSKADVFNHKSSPQVPSGAQNIPNDGQCPPAL